MECSHCCCCCRRRRCFCPTGPILQGWRAARVRAAQLSTRIRLAFGRGRARRPAATAGGYQSLSGGGGGGSDSGGAGEGSAGAGADGSSDGMPSLPSRLREVLVAGSVDSATTSMLEGGTPPSQRPFLGSIASSSPSAFSPGR